MSVKESSQVQVNRLLFGIIISFDFTLLKETCRIRVIFIGKSQSAKIDISPRTADPSLVHPGDLAGVWNSAYPSCILSLDTETYQTPRQSPPSYRFAKT